MKANKVVLGSGRLRAGSIIAEEEGAQGCKHEHDMNMCMFSQAASFSGFGDQAWQSTPGLQWKPLPIGCRAFGLNLQAPGSPANGAVISFLFACTCLSAIRWKLSTL